MTRRLPLLVTLAAAAAALLVVLSWFFPGTPLQMMPAAAEQRDFRALTVARDGQYHSCRLPGSQSLFQALAQGICVRLPWSSGCSGLSSGDICFFAGEMYAVVTPQGTYLYSVGDAAGYAVLGAGAELYQEVSRALHRSDGGEEAQL